MTDRWGLDVGYWDAQGVWHATVPETRQAILDAMGVTPDTPAEPAVHVVPADEPVSLPGPGEIELETGEIFPSHDAARPLPAGYHRLHRASSPPELVIASPGRCHLPAELHGWGWAVQAYALRSQESWGFGDLADLRRLGRWTAEARAGNFLLLSPLYAVLPVLSQQPSPYFPSTRRFHNPLYLRIEEVPGIAEAGVDIEGLAAAGRALNGDRRIDRDEVFRLKMAALERCWDRLGESPGLESYRAEQGESLARFATFCALAERHRGGWRDWPPEYRRPASPAVAEFAACHRERVGFHEWLQWLLDRQLAAASARIGIVHDLPVGFDASGADAWDWQDLLATGVTVGAPADEFAPGGQDWGLPAFVPHRLRAVGYRPFVETLRMSLRHGRGLRIDHVMGLFRLFWIPGALGPSGGAYVRYPVDELLAIVALESERARAVIIGEDLGTVEEGVREELARRRVLSYRLMWFEPKPPECYPRLSLAAITTHDLPTVAGLWGGADLAEQRACGLEPGEEGATRLRSRLQTVTGLDERADTRTAIVAAHRALAQSPSVMVVATLEDALAVESRPNMPGTTAAVRPNWSLALPPLEVLEATPLTAEVARTLDERTAP